VTTRTNRRGRAGYAEAGPLLDHARADQGVDEPDAEAADQGGSGKGIGLVASPTATVAP
jgi:hypothetical protein